MSKRTHDLFCECRKCTVPILRHASNLSGTRIQRVPNNPPKDASLLEKLKWYVEAVR